MEWFENLAIRRDGARRDQVIFFCKLAKAGIDAYFRELNL